MYMERTLTFTVEDALLSPISFAMLSGAGLADFGNDKINFIHTTFDLPLDENGKVTLDAESADVGNEDYAMSINSVSIVNNPDDYPIFATILDNTGAGVDFFKATMEGGKQEKKGGKDVLTLSGADGETPITFTLTDTGATQAKIANHAVGTNVRIDCYIAKSSRKSQSFTIDAKKFAGNFYVEADTLFRDEYSGEDMPAVFVIPNAKIQSNFTFNMANTGDPSTFTFTMDAFPAYTRFDNTHKVFAEIQIIGDENLEALKDPEDKGTEDKGTGGTGA